MDDATDPNLNAYLDGSLQGEALKVFEQRLRNDAALRAQVHRAQRIDQSLRESFTGASALTSAQILALAGKVAETATTDGGSSIAATTLKTSVKTSTPWAQRLAVAAALAGGLFGAWMIWQQVRPEPEPQWAPNPAMMKNAGGYYNTKVASGFEPSWVCENETVFASTFRDRLGQALKLNPSPDAGTHMLGLDYAPVLSPMTVGMLAKSEDKPVVLVIDKRDRDDENAMRASCGSLHVFRRELGPLVMYEITPFEQARMLDLIEAIE